MECCILCNKSLTGLETVTVKKKGVENLKKCSLQRNDGLIELMLKKEELLVHVSCRKAYINENMIKSYLKKKKLDTLFFYVHVDSQEESLEFDFNLKCIFCNQDAKEDNSNKDRVRTIKMAKTMHSIENYALKRGDSVSETILSGDSLREVGKISHGWDRELVSFTTLVQLPDTAALPKHKALVLAAAFLLEYTYFEKSKRSCGLCC